MLRIIYTTLRLLAIITVSSSVMNCKAGPIEKKIKKSPFIVTIDLVNVKDDMVKVEIGVNHIDADSISYFLPKIVPGTYQNNNFGEYIENFKALDYQGNALPVQKLGENQWKINNVKQLQKITYWVNDTFDIESTHEVFSPTGSNILKDKNFILNLHTFVGYFFGMKENTYKLFIKHPTSLSASTSLEETLPTNSNTAIYDTDLFIFKRYAEVVDNPIMYSIADTEIFTIKDMEILLSVYSKNKTHTAAKIMPQLERVIRAQKNFLGDINSTKKYSILLYLSSSKANDAKGFGALEHNTSTVIVLPESLSREKLDKALTDVVSHEFFHIVTPLTIHSEEIHDFDYNNPKMSQHLWLYEGTTEYFSLLFQITQGLIPKEEFFNRLIEKIDTSKNFDNTMSFATMSKNILSDPYHENYRNVYEKGALISLCIDIIMRENSNGAYGILDLVKNLSARYGSETPFKDEELIEVIKEESFPEVSDFLTQHVIKNTPIDYEFYLNKVGIKYGIKDVPSSYFIFEQQPFVKGVEATKEVLFIPGVGYNNFLNNLGILGGDILVSINNKAYTLENIYDLFGDSNKWKEGEEISFKIKRNDKIIDLKSKVIKPTVEKTIFIENQKASQEQKKLLKKWIND